MKRTINVKGSEIAVYRKEQEDYISLTDMVRTFEDGLVLIEKWLRNKNTIEFIGIWEQLHNPIFNSPEFEGIRDCHHTDEIAHRRKRHQASWRPGCGGKIMTSTRTFPDNILLFDGIPDVIEKVSS